LFTLPEEWEKALSQFSGLYKHHLTDWGTNDSFSLKVLGRLVKRAKPKKEFASYVLNWKHSELFWQRRASHVCFVTQVKHGDKLFDGFTAMLVENLDHCLREGHEERFCQTGVGWVSRYLFLADRKIAVDFVERNLKFFSPEGLRYSLEKASSRDKKRLTAAHKKLRKR